MSRRIRNPAPNHSDASYAALKARNDFQLTRAEAEALGVPYVPPEARS